MSGFLVFGQVDIGIKVIKAKKSYLAHLSETTDYNLKSIISFLVVAKTKRVGSFPRPPSSHFKFLNFLFTCYG